MCMICAGALRRMRLRINMRSESIGIAQPGGAHVSMSPAWEVSISTRATIKHRMHELWSTADLDMQRIPGRFLYGDEIFSTRPMPHVDSTSATSHLIFRTSYIFSEVI